MNRELVYKRLNSPSGWGAFGPLKSFKDTPTKMAPSENNQNSNDQKKFCKIDPLEKISEINNQYDLLKLPINEGETFQELFEKKKNLDGKLEFNNFVYEKHDNKILVTRNMPVKIVYKSYSIKKKDLPELNDLSEHLKACLHMERNKDNNQIESDVEEMEDAIKILSEDEINVLQISDYNTNGVNFPKNGFQRMDAQDRASNPWYAVLHGMGDGAKDDKPDNHGSHGVGKFANFHLSVPRIILYRSRFSDNPFSKNENIRQAFGGRIISRSHTYNGKDYNAEANIGKRLEDIEDCVDPYTNVEEFPEFVKKEKSDETGLDIFVIGFNKKEGWDLDIIASSLTKFQIPIMKGNLCISVNDQVIDKDTMSDYYESEKLKEHLENLPGGTFLNSFEKGKWYYELYRRDPEKFSDDEFKTSVKTFEMAPFGKFKVSILINKFQYEAEDDNPLKDISGKTVGWFRQGMFVCDSSNNKPKIFGEFRFANYPKFIAAVECIDSAGIKIFRDRENAAHNDFILLNNDEYSKQFIHLKDKLRRKLREWILGSENETGEGIQELNEMFTGNKGEGINDRDPSNQKKDEIKDKERKKSESQKIIYIRERSGKKFKKPKPGPTDETIPKIVYGKSMPLKNSFIFPDPGNEKNLKIVIEPANPKAFRGRVQVITSPSFGKGQIVNIKKASYNGKIIKCENGGFEEDFAVGANNTYTISTAGLGGSRLFEIVVTPVEVKNENK